MPADTTLLVVEFRTPYYEVLNECASAQMPMEPYFTLRDPWAQARMWRQSRSRRQVEDGIAMLIAAGAPWLASVLEEVGPQYGGWATNALPGDSWHQFREASDAVAVVNGVYSWDTIRGKKGGPGDAYYRFYAERLAAHGLTSLGPSTGDWCHGQLRAAGAPHHVMPWTSIESEMCRRFRKT